jgi:hypothetical protein
MSSCIYARNPNDMPGPGASGSPRGPDSASACARLRSASAKSSSPSPTSTSSSPGWTGCKDFSTSPEWLSAAANYAGGASVMPKVDFVRLLQVP